MSNSSASTSSLIEEPVKKSSTSWLSRSKSKSLKILTGSTNNQSTTDGSNDRINSSIDNKGKNKVKENGDGIKSIEVTPG